MNEISRRSVLGAGIAGVAAALLGNASAMGARRAQKETRHRIVVDGLDVSVLSDAYLDLLKKGGVNCVHRTMTDLASFGNAYEFVAHHAERMVIAKSVREIRQAVAQRKVALLLGWQSADELAEPLRSSDSFATMNELLGAYDQLGLRFVGICYNSSNLFGGGNLDPRGSLTRAGRRLVEEIHKRRLVLDVGGHTGEQTSLDALEMSEGVPVICTHTNMAAINPSIRCISDRLAVAIASSGGVIGLTAVNDFHVRSALTAKAQGRISAVAPLSVHLDQYDYLKRLVGVDHIGIGPDFVTGISGEVPTPDLSVDWPFEDTSEGPLLYVKGFEDISMLPNVTNGLKARGWSESELDLVLGGNWLRVYEQIWGE